MNKIAFFTARGRIKALTAFNVQARNVSVEWDAPVKANLPGTIFIFTKAHFVNVKTSNIQELRKFE